MYMIFIYVYHLVKIGGRFYYMIAEIGSIICKKLTVFTKNSIIWLQVFISSVSQIKVFCNYKLGLSSIISSVSQI